MHAYPVLIIIIQQYSPEPFGQKLFVIIVNGSVYPLGSDSTGYTQKDGAVSIVKTIDTAPLFCVYPVYHLSPHCFWI
jgi:hypothetical protein